MHRTPNDGQEEHIYDQKPQRRKKLPPEQSETQYFGEEEPHQPRIRRASLRLDPATISSSTSAKLTRIEKPLYRHSTAQTEQKALSETSTRLPRIERPASPGRSGGARLAPPERRPTEIGPAAGDKILVAQRKRKAVYEPPAPTRSRPGRSRAGQRTISTGLFHRFGQYQTLILSGIGILIVLLLLPLLSHVIFPQTQSASTLIPSGGTNIGSSSSNTGSSGANVNTNHDIVLVPPKGDHPMPPVYATSAYLLDADTGQVLYAHNAFMHLPMLSTTKLMTATLAVEQGNLDQKITITNAIANDVNQLSADSSVMGVKKGETYTLRELLYGLMLVSGNDAAIVIADGLDGNLPTFVAKMNARAAQLGMHDTHYMNPHGLLTDNHYSSAHDLAIIGKYAFSLPAIHQISGTKQYNIPQTSSHAAHTLLNGNQFLWWYPGVDAGKPGYDGARDFVQVISSVRNNHHLIGVTMNTIDWWTDMRDLMNWGFNTFTWVSPRLSEQQSPIIYDADWNYFIKDQPSITIPMGNQGRYYIYSGYSLTGPILPYYDKSGSFKKFGYPEGPAKPSTTNLVTQRFDHGSIQCDLTTQQCKTL